jgi:CheY-like chemotaxis protein
MRVLCHKTKINSAKIEKEASVAIMMLMKYLISLIKDFFAPPTKTRTILIIDDSEVDRTFAARVLGQKYKVLSAASGNEGIQVALKELPDLILLDYMMPGMNGPEVCRILKQNANMLAVPVIFLTSMDTPNTVVDGLEEGAEAYLIKPINARDLLAEVKLRIEPLFVERKGR